MSRMHGKVAVITGGSSGIGLATAKRYVEEGAYVYIFGRRQEELDKAVKEIGRNVTAVRGDVTDLADLDRLYAQVAADKRKVDVLMAGAGFVEHQRLGEITEAHYDKTFGLNARGLLFTVQKALPLMGQGGSIILIGSIAALMGFPAHTTYSGTKAAIRSFARTWTIELKDRGIRVNVISPGPIDTPIIDSQAPTKEGADRIRENFIKVIPLGRMGRAEEVAHAAVFLGSDESSFVAGIDLVVDGGMAAV
ncbi:NAD(P)-dependent dehydrogenase, short-chain alcohol dehydrogenase family [Rhizobiales bacterium GAS191]|jgi:NAD(P)-dependent dehydrogenase (short-subunit alcohol dehydrogenase family)|nr:NAD(P)-dependent dehydrogenase, short-chain alcohol dehydrogenase family [Rhizobiales bacterium GAS113]SEC55994.1 NAD(P)-dependent dehydrogenase, short-chain alcohol dehydrogenase family [Rhizobiales bacterium GAS191]